MRCQTVDRRLHLRSDKEVRSRPNVQASSNCIGEECASGRDIAIAIAQYETTIKTGFKEVADALTGRATLAEQLQAQTAKLKAEKTRMGLTDLRFQTGAANYFDVLDAQRSLFTAQQAVVHLQQQRDLVSL